MANRPFHFLHASDFHLEQPATGLSEAPPHLLDTLLDAPYAAAQRVFDTAITEDAAFVVLSGDILHVDHAGPRGPLFLLDQFQRLATHGIAVYWAGGNVDPPESWPEAIPLPSNVRFFPTGHVAEYLVERDGVPLARVIGASVETARPLRPGEYHRDPAGLFTVAATFGETEAATLAQHEIDYWAFGGRHERSTLSAAPRTIHYPGSPQGRRFEEGGLHGCTVVHVDESRQVRPHFIPTDAVRYFSERLSIDATCSRNDLESRLRQRMQALLEAAPKVDSLIAWVVTGGGPLVSELMRGDLANDVLAKLRAESGTSRPAAWIASLEAEWSQPFPADWYDQENMRGDFLRLLRRLEMNPEEVLDLDTYVFPQHLKGPLAFAPRLPQGDARQRLLREAAILGIDLLGPEESQG